VKKQKVWFRTFVVALASLLSIPSLFFPAVSASGTDTLTLFPASGPPGIQVAATGKFTGYGANDTVTLWWDFVSKGRFLGSTPLRSDGTFALPVTIPPDAAMGSHPIVADVNFGYASFSQSFQINQKNRTAALIYNTDSNTTLAFKALLDGNGFATSLISLNNLANAGLAGFDLILIGHDTAASNNPYEWAGTNSDREKIKTSGKPIVGLGGGGAAFFQELNLSIRFGQTWNSSGTQVAPIENDRPYWSIPYVIPIVNGAVSIYSNSSSFLSVYLPTPKSEILPIGRQVNDSTHYPIIAEAGRYLLWGFYNGPSAMTTAGKELFANLLWYLLEAQRKDTLVLTDYQRMETLGYGAGEVTGLRNDLQNLAGLPKENSNMVAVRRDLTTDASASVTAGCATWKAGNEGSVAQTNTCVDAIDGYIEHLKQSSYPNLSYLILVGASEVIPMKAREQDHLISAQEKNWGAGLPAPDSYIKQLYSTPGAINGWGHYLTDSKYSDLSYVDDGWGDQHELVPELAVGRLVETPTQISALVNTYIANNAYFSRAKRVSIASSDYLDGGTLAADYMDPGTDDALVQNSYDSNEVPPKLNAKYNLVYFGGHGNYNTISTGSGSFVAGDHAASGDTAALNDLPNAVIVTSGCHNGASFGNNLYHAPDAGTTYSEFPEEFSKKKAGVYVGATGYTIITGTGSGTDVSEVRHNEKLSTYMIKHLDQDGNITAGESFKRAVNSYISDVGSIGTVERRVISITTLYGIPNYRTLELLLPRPWIYQYRLRPIWIDPPPYVDPRIIRLRVEFILNNWEIKNPGGGPAWYLKILGASYGGRFNEPLLPLVKSMFLLPPHSTIQSLTWDQSASKSHSWTAGGPLYVPPIGEDPWQPDDTKSRPFFRQSLFQSNGFFPKQPYEPLSTSTLGDQATEIGLRIMPLQHDTQTLETVLWTKLVFEMTLQSGQSSDSDGDGLPDYWELAYGLNPYDSTGINGAEGDPDQDGITNIQEFQRGLNPQNPDTDHDGWTDGAEIASGNDPLNPGDSPVRLFLPVLMKN
jgi:hypothetical protein